MPSKILTGSKRSRGRPIKFDRVAAVKAATELFWERGYEGSSFDDLTSVMGINASSFRNTFKSKEALYREVVNSYSAEVEAWFDDEIGRGNDIRAAFARAFDELAAKFTQENRPAGCLISLAAVHTPPALASLRELASDRRAATETSIVERLRRGQIDGDVDQGANIEATAAFFNAVFRGMAVQARDGASRDRLREIANVAMVSFPSAGR